MTDTPTKNKVSVPDVAATAVLTLAYAMLAGLVGVGVFAARVSGASPWSVLGVGALLGAASALFGALVGFLFGIPRAAAIINGATYKPNTNLEEISDWLTKILVGVGLTQIATFPGFLNRVSAYFAPGLGGSPAAPTLATAIILFFVTAGFLFGYLWTRFYLAGALARADRLVAGLQEELHQARTERQALAATVDTDEQAFKAVDEQLGLAADKANVPQDRLNGAVASASDRARDQIFSRAQTLRGATWRDNKVQMERTIPVFRALIAAEGGNPYHGNHGQLGFALKDQSIPDWSEAKAEFDQAIKLRDQIGDEHLFYELNRAICRIMLDPARPQERASAPDLRFEILADLRVANRNLPQLIQEIPEIRHWLQTNRVESLE
ncbi:MAG: hypothetical protein WC876_02290 [Candidatus Thermoplasmatota archaeon]|jgi:hypothetical protein